MSQVDFHNNLGFKCYLFIYLFVVLQRLTILIIFTMKLISF